MSLRDQCFKNPFLQFDSNVFLQKDLPHDTHFEERYLKLREKENRIHSDGIVRKLPEFPNNHPHKKEWDMRKSSLKKIIDLLAKDGSKDIMELGCGNGWVSFNIATKLNVDVCAVDVNEVELLQGGSVFREQKNLCFVRADIFGPVFKSLKFHAIILNGSIQYFENLKTLFTTLFELLDDTGKIYLVDSPLYTSGAESGAAKKRSERYFESLGFPEMASHFFHHNLIDLKSFNYTVKYNPMSIDNLFKRTMMHDPLSIFPIICITK